MNTSTVQKRAVIFLHARSSGADGPDREGEDDVVVAQRERCREAAGDLQAAVVREYVEHGGAGYLDTRPVLQLMLDELRALRDAEYVIVASLDRISRRISDRAWLRLELEADGAQLITTSQLPSPQPIRKEVIA